MAAQIVDAQFVKAHIGKMIIVDVRPEEMYNEGHIPTAINISLMDFDKYGDQEAEELSKAYRKHALTEDTPMIIYCQIGKHAKLSCDFLESENYKNLYLYLGSFQDWTKDPSNPIEK